MQSVELLFGHAQNTLKDIPVVLPQLGSGCAHRGLGIHQFDGTAVHGDLAQGGMIHLHEHLALLDMGIVQDLLDVHNGTCGDAVGQYQLGGLVGGQILDPLLNDLGNGILIGQTARHIHEPGIGDHVRAFQHLIAELFVQLLIMPIIVLSLGVNAGFVRLTRSSMLEVMRQDYVTTARAKGVSKKDVTFRHQLRNSMIPIVTTMGMRLGSMVGSTVLIESLFVIPGLGSVMMNGISNRDFMLVANGVLIISIFVAICNLVVDILYGIIDPRTR